MDGIENCEEHLLVISCDYGRTILLIKLLVEFFPTATFTDSWYGENVGEINGNIETTLSRTFKKTAVNSRTFNGTSMKHLKTFENI